MMEEPQREELSLVRALLEAYPPLKRQFLVLNAVTSRASYPLNNTRQLAELLEAAESEEGGANAGLLQVLLPYYFPITSIEDLVAKFVYAHGTAFGRGIGASTEMHGRGSIPTSDLARHSGGGVLAQLTSAHQSIGSASVTEQKLSGELAPSAAVESDDPWYRTGHVLFTGLSGWELGDFYVIREGVRSGFFPSNGFWYDTEGFWFRPAGRTNWFKIPGLSWRLIQN